MSEDNKTPEPEGVFALISRWMMFIILFVIFAVASLVSRGQTLYPSVTYNGTTNALVKPTAANFALANSLAVTTGNLSQFASTTSAQLAGVISDETGSGALVFANSPSFTTPTLGVASATSLTLSGSAGAGFVSYPSQSSTPAAPASGYVEFANSTGQRAWRRASDGFVRAWNSTLTANRTWTMADADGDVAIIASTGIPARTASATWAARTITGTSGQITVTNGDGVSGNPTVSLPSTISQATTFSAGTASTSTSTGAVILSGSGGLGVGGAGYFGGIVDIKDVVRFGNTVGTSIGATPVASMDIDDGSDSSVRLWRSTTEWLQIAAARGGFTGQNNVYILDRVGSSATALRALRFRSSLNGGTSYATLLDINGTDTSTSGRFDGVTFRLNANTVNDSSTAASGTAALLAVASFEAPTLTATNAGVTTTNAATVYINGNPTASTNQTITNAWGLWNVGATRLDGAVRIGGSNGTAADLIASASATLDFPSISASGGTQDLTITVTGASTGDVVQLGLPAAPSAGVVFNAWVSAANTVTVRATNATGSPIDPASATYRVAVTSF